MRVDDSFSPRITPAIHSVFNEAVAAGLTVAEMLDRVDAHAVRYRNALKFGDAVDLAKAFEQRTHRG